MINSFVKAAEMGTNPVLRAPSLRALNVTAPIVGSTHQPNRPDLGPRKDVTPVNTKGRGDSDEINGEPTPNSTPELRSSTNSKSENEPNSTPEFQTNPHSTQEPEKETKSEPRPELDQETKSALTPYVLQEPKSNSNNVGYPANTLVALVPLLFYLL